MIEPLPDLTPADVSYNGLYVLAGHLRQRFIPSEFGCECVMWDVPHKRCGDVRESTWGLTRVSLVESVCEWLMDEAAKR